MYRSLADGLPPELAAQVNPVWRANEATYWEVRDELLAQYAGQWVAFAEGRVAAAGRSAVAVTHKAGRTHPFAYEARCGHEFEPSRIRSASFPYDAAYSVEAMPLFAVECRAEIGSQWVALDRVIPDIGADNSVLPWADLQAMGFDTTQGIPSFMSGVAGGVARTFTLRIVVALDGTDYPCRVQADFQSTERLLGRDVLNQLRILFDGPAGGAVVNPEPRP